MFPACMIRMRAEKKLAGGCLVGRQVAHKLNNVTVRVVAEELLDAEVAIAAFPKLDSGFPKLVADSLNVSDLKSHMIRASDAPLTIRLGIGRLNQMELPVAQRVPSARESERRPTYLFKPQNTAKELLCALEVLDRERDVM